MRMNLIIEYYKDIPIFIREIIDDKNIDLGVIVKGKEYTVRTDGCDEKNKDYFRESISCLRENINENL